MSFGKRETAPALDMRSRFLPTPAREGCKTGRGRIGYLWAMLAVAVTGLAGPAIMGAMPAVNSSGASLTEISLAALEGVLPSLLIACAIVMPLVDLGLKSLKWRKAWLYGLFSAVGVVLLINGLMSIGSPSKPLWVLRLALAPSLIGGLVLGVFRVR